MTVREQITHVVSGAHAEPIKNAADGIAVGTIVGVFMGWLPHLAAILTAIWLTVRLYNEIMVAVDRRRDRRVAGK